jgi:hypothetical protein
VDCVGMICDRQGMQTVLCSENSFIRPLGSPRRRGKDNSKTCLSEIGSETRRWIGLVQDCIQCQTLMSAVSSLRILLQEIRTSDSQSVSQSVSQLVSQSVSQSASQPASQPVSQSAKQSAGHPASQPTSQSVRQSASQSVSVSQSVSQPASQSVSQSVSHL